MSKPDCIECGGACCKTINIPVAKMSAKMLEFVKTRGTLKDGKWCIPSVCRLLQSGRCSNYDRRPAVCREYPVGGERCLKARAEYGK